MTCPYLNAYDRYYLCRAKQGPSQPSQTALMRYCFKWYSTCPVYSKRQTYYRTQSNLFPKKPNPDLDQPTVI